MALVALSKSQRDALDKAISEARRLLEEDLAREAEGRFGIHESGHLDPEESLHLDPTFMIARRELAGVVEHLQAEGESAQGAVERLIRESSFTHLNRLVAIRVAEAIGLIPPSLAEGRDSRGYREFIELAPLLADDATGGYWTYLGLCADELSSDVPVLFDPRNPLLGLAPSPGALDDLVKIVSTSSLDGAWEAPDSFGWTYQFFNSQQERRLMREQSASPRNSRELAVRNQFFTPRYVVDFLVHNSLGRRLLEADPATPLRDELEYLVDPPNEPREPVQLGDVRVLDPACGSGHFLLGAYDVLERAWELQGTPPAEAAPHILGSLWGVDIDARCAQVASAALILRARRYAREGELPTPNIITARALPEDPEVWEQIVGAVSPERRKLLERVTETLRGAPVLGPLLRVEEQLKQEIERAVPQTKAEEGTIFEAMGVASDAFGRVEAEVIEALRHIARDASSTSAERLFAAEAEDAIRFVEAMRQRYDAVLMNPPFGEPVPGSKEYLKAAYPWIPTRDYNLFSAFVGRGVELCTPGGILGAITSRTAFFLMTFERWRREVVLIHELREFVDLGHDVMEDAMVEAACYTIRAAPRSPSPPTFIRLLKESNLAPALRAATRALRRNEQIPHSVRVSLELFERTPGATFTYWGSSLVEDLASFSRLEGTAAEVRVGLQTGDDFRFVRAFWEVSPARVGRSRTETRIKAWAFFAKGGEYSPFWADVHLVVNWMDEGAALRGFPGARVQNEGFYFSGGVTWPARTNSAFGPQWLPPGTIFSHRGLLARPLPHVPLGLLLAWLSSRWIRVAVEARAPSGEETATGGVPSRDYTVGMVQPLPWPNLVQEELREAVERIVRLQKQLHGSDETTLEFACPSVIGHGHVLDAAIASESSDQELAVEILEAYADIDESLRTLLERDESAGRVLDELAGPLVARLRRDPLTVAEIELVSRLYSSPLSEVVESATQRVGIARFIRLNYHVASRRLELLSHALQVHPSSIVGVQRERGLLPPHQPKTSADDLVSYLVGCSLGRWDIRVGRDRSFGAPSHGLLDPLPLCPPGMLVGENGIPIQAAPGGYPIQLPPDRILLDEPGHPWDIEERVRLAAAYLFEDPDVILAETEEILRVRSLREYLRKRFFNAHLARYSKSRRKAPIYWQLSVPSRNWSVWAYAPELSREMLFAIAQNATRREALCHEAIRRLRAASDGAQTPKQTTTRLVKEEELSDELAVFRAQAERVARLGWEPDLDDGIVLAAAPLADLFPAWLEAAIRRKELREGNYPWATVAKWADQI